MCIMQINCNNRTISTKDNAKGLKGWMGDVEVEIVDEVLEYLIERELLTEQGKRVAEKFWKMYIEDTS